MRNSSEFQNKLASKLAGKREKFRFFSVNYKNLYKVFRNVLFTLLTISAFTTTFPTPSSAYVILIGAPYRVRLYIAQLAQGIDSNYEVSLNAGPSSNLYNVSITRKTDLTQTLKTLTFQIELQSSSVRIKPETISAQFKVGGTSIQYTGSKFYNGLNLLPSSLFNPIQIMTKLALRSSNNPTSNKTELQYKGRYWTITDAGGALSAAENTTEDMSMIHSGNTIADANKHGEHEQMLKLLKYTDNPDKIIRSGNWSDPLIWEKGSIPQTNADVLIPEGLTVTIDKDYLNTPFHNIRVDGTITFLTSVNTALKVRTLIINSMGSFIMGTDTDRIHTGVTSQIIISDRGIRDDAARLKDPIDIDGGVIAHGPVFKMYGEEKTGHMIPNEILNKNISQISFVTAPKGWHVGDTLLFPTTADPGSFGVSYWNFPDQDELIKIASISSDGRTVTLEHALAYDHLAPVGVQDPNDTTKPLRIPVGNLTRNAFFKSEFTARTRSTTVQDMNLQRRGHFMVMHTQSGIVIDSAGFYELGRTDAAVILTVPMLDANGHTIPGTDTNTIGRYALHIHDRTGNDVNKSPILIKNCAIQGSPKHGLVNHGGNVIADGNVTYDIQGSHFFSENGSEIGAFSNNLAVGSLGPIPPNGPNLRFTGATNQLTNNNTVPAFDAGWEGFGFWMQGGGVRVVGNYAFHHRNADYAYYCLDIRDGVKDTTLMVDGKLVPFVTFHTANMDVTDADGNVDPDKVAHKKELLDAGLTELSLNQLPIVFARNVGSGAPSGLLAEYLNESTNNNYYAKIQDSVFWATTGYGVNGRYSERLYLKNITSIRDATNYNLSHDPNWPTYGGGFGVNFHTTSVIFDHVHFEGWSGGITMPLNGTNIVKDSYFKNKINISISDADSPESNVDVNPRHVIIQNNQFEVLNQKSYSNEPSFDIYISGRYVNNDPTQLPDPSVWQNGNNLIEIKDQDMSTLRIGSDNVPNPFYDRFTITLISPLFTNQTAPYVAVAMRNAYPNPINNASSAPVILNEGWNTIPILVTHWTSDCTNEPVGCKDQTRYVQVYRDTTPPTFTPDPTIPLYLDPSHLSDGFFLRGTIVDQLGNIQMNKDFAQQFDNLTVDTDGIIRLHFSISDNLGNTAPITVNIYTFRSDDSIMQDMAMVIQNHSVIKGSSNYIAGFDLNSDGSVNSSDVIIMRNMWTLDAETWSTDSTKFLTEVSNHIGKTVGDPAYFSQFDVDYNGVINNVDYLKIQAAISHGRA